MAVATMTIIAAAGLILGAASTYKQMQASSEARADQRKANEVSQAETAAGRQQQVRDQVRQDRIRRAQILQSSVDSGVQASSGELGAMSSSGSQTGYNISTISRGGNSQAGYNMFNQSAANNMASSQLFGSVANLGFGVAGQAAGTRSFQSDWDKWFGPPTTGINAPPR